MKTIEDYLTIQLDASEEQRVEQEREIADLEEALATTSGVLTDLLLAYEEFVTQVEGLVAEYKDKAYKSEYLYTLEETKVGERDDG